LNELFLIFALLVCYNGEEVCKGNGVFQKGHAETLINLTTPWEKIEEKPIYYISEKLLKNEEDLRTRHQCLPDGF